MNFRWLSIGILACAFTAAPAFAFETPVNDGFVTDTVGIMSPEEHNQIENTLSNYQKRTTNEIAVLIVQTMSGQSIADAAIQTHRDWGVGSEENDNGILLLIAYADRELFMSVGYGLEGAVPDLVAKGIIEQDISPAFKEGDFALGIEQGIEALEKHIGGEYTADRFEEDSDVPWEFLLYVFLIFFEFIGARLSKSKSWWAGGILGAVFGFIAVAITGWWLSVPLLTIIGLLFDYIVSRKGPRRGRGSHWWMGGGGGHGTGGGSSGGFGGFGGGSTGGGGAGGSW